MPDAPPVPPLAYRPVPLTELLNLPALPSEAIPTTPSEASVVSAHRLLASVDAIAGVLDMLNERLAAIGEAQYRGLVGTAQRQAHHVEGALRAMARGLPSDLAATLTDRVEIAPPVDKGTEADTDRTRARRRLSAAVDALRATEQQLADTVALGRKAGVTWDETAEILGMTRQGATKRYGRGRGR
jgi:hypothetical protein